MSSNVDTHVREVPYHRGCTFDGGDPNGPLCANTATWHVIHVEGDEFALYLACPEHLPFIATGAVDYHTVGECCGEPGAKWQFRHMPGESFCFQGGDEQKLSAELFELDETKKVNA